MPDTVARAGADLALGPSCRRLIAISDSALNIARRDWQCRFGEDEAKRLAAKVRVLLPPQCVLLEPATKDVNPRPLFAFVGADFYRKGGLQVLEALHRLSLRGIRDWDAVIVGRLGSFGDYASGTGPDSRQRAVELLRCLEDRVEHHERLSASDVLGLLCRADFFLFPTLADTFGYSALEAMACGAVVITTNVRAMAEVVDGSIGFSIRLPLDENREIHRRADFPSIKESIVDLLEESLCQAISMPVAERLAMASRATARLRERHSPSDHASSMQSIYREALGIS
jgi:glycosyltransferase involved in cell wall biosynthesis